MGHARAAIVLDLVEQLYDFRSPDSPLSGAMSSRTGLWRNMSTGQPCAGRTVKSGFVLASKLRAGSGCGRMRAPDLGQRPIVS